ncbi:uncharacterized protein TM35_000771090 [Trypanosoma theileri]|uniref:EGF domain-specific O-linked N-acetylglucosamine transferase n=1 Tax=Trypanosoma theileri TaxID=67003 RepID=A0A1X0NGJ1_9TRYP|nr:uncharacterized protein TM35_000771090 [Trypanosoma theileri]ORC83147.1 hypothetical protein TM35_000771090 [Trypanosoma theileri]
MHHRLRSHVILLFSIFLFSVLSTVAGWTTAGSLQPNCAASYSQAVDLDNPNVLSGAIGTVRTYEGCFQRHRDRFVVVSPQRTTPSPKLFPSCQYFLHRNKTLTMYYLVSDICRMGHSTKDAPHLMTFLIDYFAPCSLLCRKNSTRLRVQLKILYGNVCASYPVPKLDRSFRTVVLGWFQALLRSDSPFMKLMSSWGIDFVTSRLPTGNVKILAEEIFYKEAMQEKGFFCPRGDQVPLNVNNISILGTSAGNLEINSGLRIIVRWERFRWFRTRAQANLFRECLLQYYEIPPRPKETSLLLLRRPGERHFDESKWYNLLNVTLASCEATVNMETFSSMSYYSQASLMHNSSIFIAAHGAGVVNIMAMTPGSVVVELFPHGFRYAMYEELAILLGLHYIPYESPKVWPPKCCSVRWEDRASKFMPPLKNETLPKTSFGVRSCKECDIKVSFNDMTMIIRDALSLLAAREEEEV